MEVTKQQRKWLLENSSLIISETDEERRLGEEWWENDESLGREISHNNKEWVIVERMRGILERCKTVHIWVPNEEWVHKIIKYEMSSKRKEHLQFREQNDIIFYLGDNNNEKMNESNINFYWMVSVFERYEKKYRNIKNKQQIGVSNG
jgi:hypothetical protein